MRALVSSSEVHAVLDAHVDKLHDAARRLGCTEDEAFEVCRTASAELVGDLAERPETVGDLVGGLYGRARETAVRVRRGGGAPVPLDEEATGSLLGDTVEVGATEEALFDLPERRRLGVLLIDSYALTLEQAAIALHLDAAETARTVALGRIALVAAVDGRAAPSLAGHDTAVSDLGMLADGTAPVGGRFAALRRHVSSCATCAGVLGVQTRGRGLVAALPVLGLAADDRAELLTSTGQRAATLLPTAEEVRAELAGEVERPPLIPFAVIAIALAAAVLLGVGIGVLAAGGTGPDVPTAGVVETSTPTATAASPSLSVPVSDTPTTTTAPISPSPTRTRLVTTAAPTSAVTTRTSPAPATTSPASAPAITLSPSTGPNGTPVTVTGSGFPPAALVSIVYSRVDGTKVDTGSTTTDGSGRFTTTISASDPAPLLSAGAHTITASVSKIRASATFTQTS